jgi:hypothetical protein
VEEWHLSLKYFVSSFSLAFSASSTHPLHFHPIQFNIILTSLHSQVIRLEMEEVNARSYLRYGIGFITPAWSEFLQEFVKLTSTLIQLFKAELSVVGEQ